MLVEAPSDKRSLRLHEIDAGLVVIGGGLSRAPGLTDDLTSRLTRATLKGFPIPAIRLAEGGDASGARGAALHALNEAHHA